MRIKITEKDWDRCGENKWEASGTMDILGLPAQYLMFKKAENGN
jgi:hypothetical protein